MVKDKGQTVKEGFSSRVYKGALTKIWTLSSIATSQKMKNTDILFYTASYDGSFKKLALKRKG